MPARLKILSFAFAIRLVAVQCALACLFLLGFAPRVSAQVQFNGVAGVLATNGVVLGAQDHAAADPFGNVYITDPGTNQVFKVAPGGTASVWISNTAQFNGVPLNGPGAVATDHNGNVYIADTNNYRIISAPSGGAPVVLTVLASGVIPAALAVDFSGNVYVCEQNTNNVIEIQIPSGPPLGIGVSPLTLSNPQGVAVDYTGAIYIADTGNGRVVKTVGGTATILSTGSISLSQPVGVAVDGKLNVYIADQGTNQVVELPAAGTPFVLGAGSLALSQPNGISFDGKATIYIMDQGNSRVVTEQFASVNFGTVAVGATGVTIPLTFTVDAGTTIGNTYIKGAGGISPDFTATSTTCTSGTTATTCTIQLTFQPLSVGPHKAAVVINSQSSTQLISLPVSGIATGSILAFSPGAISHYAGVYNYYCYCLLADNSPQPAATAPLYIPSGMRVDEGGTLYVYDKGFYVVRAITPAGYISTVVGNDSPTRINSDPNNGDGGPSLEAYIEPQYGIGLDGQDNIYIADGAWNEVREANSSTGIINDIAGNQYNPNNCPYYDPASCPSPYTGDGGPAVGQGSDQVHVNNPFDVATDGNGNTYFSDNGNLVIRKIDSNGIITTVAGIANGVRAYSGDGLPATHAQFYNPTTLVVDAAGDLIIGDPNNAVVREVTTDGIMHTIVGNHALGAGYTGDNGPATDAQINYPSGVALDGGGNMYIADQYNDAIRMVTTDGTISTVAAIGPCNPPNASEMCYLGPNPGNGSGAGPQYAGPFVAQPFSIAAEANGNLFFADYNGNVIDKIDVADPPSLNFGTVSVGTGSFELDVTIQNLGTSPMHITQFTISTNFIFGSDSTCNTGGGTVILAPGHSCMIGIQFWPLASGNQSGTVGITSDAQGGSTTSIPLSGTGQALPQTISFSGLTNQTYSPTPITLGATSSSGLPITYKIVSGLATVAGNQLTMTGVGAITVQATQAGNQQYTAATPVSVSFQVSPVMTPHPQSTLVNSPNTISWVTGPADTSFELLLGTTGQGSNDLFDSGVITATSVNLPVLPNGGAHIYATLRSNSLAMGWQSNYINYLEGQIATMATPAPGSTLTASSALFNWNDGSGVTAYELWVGTTGVGSSNLYNSGSTTNDTINVTNLPTTGATLYVRLFSMISGSWTSIDYTYTEVAWIPATLTSPTASPLAVSQLFTWQPGAGDTQYALRIGSTGVGSVNLYNGPDTTNLSATVNNLPHNGETVYVRLFSLTGGGWLYNDYTFTAFTGTPATLNPISGGNTLSGATQIFTWTAGVGDTQYALRIGSTGVGSTNLYNGPDTTNLSATVNNLPLNGETVYVRLFSLTGGLWLYNDYTFSAFTGVPATLTNPTTSPLNVNQLFTWQAGAGDTQYALRIGSTGVGSSNLYTGPDTTNLSVTVNNLPHNGETLYVRLFSLTGGDWLYNDYTFTAFTGTAATLTGPTPGTIGISQLFTWQAGVADTQFALRIGSTGVGSSDLYTGPDTTNLSVTVNNLPHNGETIYVRLFSLTGGLWLYNDYTFTAFTGIPATLNPISTGNTLGGATQIFTWNAGVGVTAYALRVGSTGPGSSDLYYGPNQTTSQSATVPHLPVNGETVYVRLLSLTGGFWLYNDYTFTAY